MVSLLAVGARNWYDACFCTFCSGKLLYASSGKKVLARHEIDPGHRARALKLTTMLTGATVTADRLLSMTYCVCDLKIHLCTFTVEHDL